MVKKNKKFKHVIGHQKKRKQRILQQAMAFHQARRLPQAEALYRQILLAEPDHPEALHYLGILAHEVGKNGIAVELMRRALTVRPDFAEAHYNLGIALEELGKADEAAASYRRVIALKTDYAEAHYNLGILLQGQGKLNEAVASFRRTLTLMPEFAEANNNLGIVLQALGKLDEAVVCYCRALALQPDYAAAHSNLGIVLQAQGKLDEAAASFRRALSLQPDYAAAHSNLGIVLQAQGKLDEAIANFRQALILQPDYAEAYNNLGIIFKDQGRLDEAIASFRQALILQPDYAKTLNNLGNALNLQGEIDEAMATYHRALTLQPDYAEAHYNLGLIFSQLGKAEDAKGCFIKALALKPDYAQAYKGLSSITKFTEVNDLIRAMEDLYSKKEEMSDADRIDLGFALGKIFEDLRDYDKSFDFLLKANLLKRGSFEYSSQGDYDFFERIKKTFSSDFFAAHVGSGNQERTPLFIVGMPRSGTTLVEQILASHPLVFGAGELAILTKLTNSICTGGIAAQFPECMLDLGSDAFERMGSDYLEKIRGYANDAEYITDKMPGNFLRVGVIKTILPNAKVIHCVRNPMDTCFSIFKNDFTETHGYAYDLDELGRYYTLYADLMAHWERVLPGFMYTLRYEKMVADQQKQTKNLLAFCGLPWDEACLTFHKTERKVETASLAQVRQPIYKDSIELWKRYEKHLEPLRKAIYGHNSWPKS